MGTATPYRRKILLALLTDVKSYDPGSACLLGAVGSLDMAVKAFDNHERMLYRALAPW